MKKIIIDGIEYVPINFVKNTERQIIKKNILFEIYPEESSKKMTWDKAVEYCKSLGEGWRLPTIAEMFYIYENKFITEDFYWSSSEGTTGFAWYFNFTNGYASNFGYKKDAYYVRAVKDL